MSDSRKLAIIGKPYNAALFRTFGASAFEVFQAEDLKEVVRELEGRVDEFGIILVTLEALEDEKSKKKLFSLGIPVIPIPTHRAEAGKAQANMEQLVNRAVGMNLDFLK